VPNNQFIVPRVGYSEDGSRVIDRSQKDVLVYSVNNQPSTLGRYFLTAAYLMVDHEVGTFTMWQGNPSKKSTLVPVSQTNAQCDSESSGDGSGNTNNGNTDGVEGGGSSGNAGGQDEPESDAATETSMSTGKIVGAAVGGAAGLACVVALVIFCLWKRRRQRASETGGLLSYHGRVAYIDNTEPKELGSSYTRATELAAEDLRLELGGGFRGYELHGSGPYGSAEQEGRYQRNRAGY
jgi:hypothetical protein